jgi:hypothetical protein
MKISLNFDFTKKRIVFAYGRFCLAKDLSMDGISGTNFHVSMQTANNSILNIEQRLKTTIDFLKNPTNLQAFGGCFGFCFMVRPNIVFINLHTSGL